MMASLYQSWSTVSVATRSLVSTLENTFMMAPSGHAAQQQRRIARGIDAQAHAAPFECVTLAGDEIVHGRDRTARFALAGLDVAKREPDLARIARQCDRGRDHIAPVGGLLDEADHIVVLDADEAQIGGLLQRQIAPPDPVERGDIGLDVAGLLPVANPDLVFLGVEILFATRDRRVLQQLETAVDAVIA